MSFLSDTKINAAITTVILPLEIAKLIGHPLTTRDQARTVPFLEKWQQLAVKQIPTVAKLRNIQDVYRATIFQIGEVGQVNDIAGGTTAPKNATGSLNSIPGIWL